jgi:signal transduction histidine kinase
MTTMVSVLSMAARGDLDPEQVDIPELMQMGVREAVRLRSLMGRLRDLFLLESNSLEQELEIVPVPIAELLEEVGGYFDRRTREKKQTFVKDFPDEGVRVLADPQFATRALSHVVYNAHVYTPAGGTIRFGARVLPGQVQFYVEDDGPGIPEDELSDVFLCFKRGRSQETLAVEGEGLGLYLARHLIHGQKGTLHLDSVAGKGTRVEVCLPTPKEGR